MIQDRDLGDETDARLTGGGERISRRDLDTIKNAPGASTLREQAIAPAVTLEQRIRAAYAIAPCDSVILGDALQGCDRDEDYLQGKNTYAWYWAIGKVLQPRSVAEIGVRFGYSIRALAKGAGTIRYFDGFDNESYIPGCLAIAERNVCDVVSSFMLHKIDTQAVQVLSDVPEGEMDLFHIDGDHTYAGARVDLAHAYRATCKTGGRHTPGYILIDDIDWHPEVKRAADDFCKGWSLAPIYLPTFRGLYVIPV